MNKIADLAEYIRQISSTVFDGAKDEDGKPLKVGLKREMDVAFTERRIMDRF